MNPRTEFSRTAPILLSFLLLGTAQAQESLQAATSSTAEPAKRLTWSLSQESWSLPDNERMGMVGGRMLMDMLPHLQVGVASYGAVRGERGGFITLGGEAQTRWPLSAQNDLVGGLF